MVMTSGTSRKIQRDTNYVTNLGKKSNGLFHTKVNKLIDGQRKQFINLIASQRTKSYHFGMTLTNYHKCRVITTGFNHIRCEKSVHCEVSMIKKLPFNRSRNKGIDIFVGRISVGSGGKDLCMSRPCMKCIGFMKTSYLCRGYHIKNVYYSNSSGAVIRNSLAHLENISYGHNSNYVLSAINDVEGGESDKENLRN